MNVSYMLVAVFAFTATPSTTVGLARSAAASPVMLRLHRLKVVRHASGTDAAQARPGASDWAYTPISSSLVSPSKPPVVPLGVHPPDRGSFPVPSEVVYSACARTMVSTLDWVALSRSAHSTRAASTKYDWKVVSQNSVLPHSVPPVSTL